MALRFSEGGGGEVPNCGPPRGVCPCLWCVAGGAERISIPLRSMAAIAMSSTETLLTPA